MFRVQPTLPSCPHSLCDSLQGFQGATAEGASPAAGALQAPWEEPERMGTWRRDSHRVPGDGHKVRFPHFSPPLGSAVAGASRQPAKVQDRPSMSSRRVPT